MNIVIATVGMSILLQNIARLIWGSEPISYPPIFRTTAYFMGPVRLPAQYLWVVLLGIVLMVLLQMFFKWTRMGIALQAAAQDPQTAQLMGINLNRAISYTFFISGGMAGAAGALLGPMFFASFDMGFMTGVKGFVAATVGGLGSITGGNAGRHHFWRSGDIWSLVDIVGLQRCNRHGSANCYSPRVPQWSDGTSSRKEIMEHDSFSNQARKLCWGLLLVAVFALAPVVHPQAYFAQILCLSMIASVLAMGLQLVIGYAGQLSIGHAAFYGIGAYTSGLLMIKIKLPFIVAFLGAGTVAAICSLALVPITRLRGTYLAVATLGFTIIVHLVILNEETVTGGPFGLMNIPYPSFGGWVLSSYRNVYYLSLTVAIVTYLSLKRIVHSRFGRALESIKQNEDAARSCGINLTLYKSKCFIIAAFTAGLAGSLYAHLNLYLNPNDFTFWKSIEILMMVVVGGVGSLEGGIVGGTVLVFALEYLRASGQLRMVIYGGLLIFFMGFGEKGLVGLWGWMKDRFKPSKLKPEQETAGGVKTP